LEEIMDRHGRLEGAMFGLGWSLCYLGSLRQFKLVIVAW